MNRSVFVVLASILLSFSPAFGQSTPHTLSETIVVTASAVPEEEADTPVATEVVTREEIERREARDVADVLREVPGITIARTGSAGKIVSLFMRGGSSKQALVLWNGVEMNNPYFSGYNLAQLSTAGVDRVEVVRGPFSALYGSEAVSGVVNVLTRSQRDGLSVDVEGGENGLFNALARGSFTAGTMNGHASVERRQDDGFFDNDQYESNLILGGFEYAPAGGLYAGLSGRYTTYDLGVPFAPNAFFTGFEPTPRRSEDGSESQFLVPLGYRGGIATYEVRLSQSERHDRFQDLEDADSSDTDARIRNARGTINVRTGRWGTLTFGGEYEESVVDHVSSFSTIDSRERSSESFFIEDRLSIPAGAESSVEMTAGLRYDHYDTFGSETTPRLAAAWKRGPHKVRAGYGRAFRAPAIGELYSPSFGNSRLEAETSRSFEAGYDFWRAGTRLSVTYFDSEYEDLIAFGPSFTFENIALARARGVELSASRRIGPWQAGASYTHLDTEDEATGEALVRRPEHSGSAFVGYVAGPLETMLVVTHRGDRLDVTDVAPFGVVTAGAYTTADVTLRYRFRSTIPYVKVENVLDEDYEEVFGYPSPSRRFIAGVRYGWGR